MTKVIVEHAIDCSAEPTIPVVGWQVKSHLYQGILKWDASNIILHLSQKQKDGQSIEGTQLGGELAEMPILNSNVLDYLMLNPHLIPEGWKKNERGENQRIFFWGTVYRDTRGRLYVRCLSFGNGTWVSGRRSLGLAWSIRNPTAVLAS